MKTMNTTYPAFTVFGRLIKQAASCGAILGMTTSAMLANPASDKSASEGKTDAKTQSATTESPKLEPLKIGIILSSTDAETVWNAFRFASFALKKGDSVKVFLLAKGVDCQKLDSKDFHITEQMQAVVDAGGKILACGTCLKLRKSEGSELCPLSTMQDMYDIVRESDKVLTF